MKKIYIPMLILLISVDSLAQQKESKITILPYLGHNWEKLDWSISGNDKGTDPDILSELKWKDLRATKLGLKAEMPILDRTYFSIGFSYSNTTAGKVTDTDYAGNNRTFPTAEFSLRADRGLTTIVSAQFIRSLIPWKWAAVALHIGYYGKYQSLYMLDGDKPLLVGKVLKSTYAPRWHNLAIGLNSSSQIGKWKADIELSYLKTLRYSASANWNLQENFMHPESFVHHSNGYGWIAGISFSHQFSSGFSPFVKLSRQYLETYTGTDILFLSSGETKKSRFNGTHNSSSSVEIGIHKKL